MTTSPKYTARPADAVATLRQVQDQSRELPPPSAPLAAAREFVNAHHRTDDGKLTLHYWQGQWWKWQVTRWAEVERVAVEKTVYTFFDGAKYVNAKGELTDWNPTRHKVTDLLAATATLTHLAKDVTQPCWTNGYRHDGVLVSVTNGLLDVRTGDLLPHTPEYFNCVSVPFDYDPEAPEPTRWLDFLARIWPNDDEQPALLQEWFGYIVSGRTDLHKIAMLIGPTRSGKGVASRVLGYLIGTENVAGPTLSSFAGDFGLSPLIGKPLAVIGDARLNGKGDHSHVVETLLSVSGEDTRTVNIKYQQQWTGRLPTRFLILSNEMPRFTDASGTIAHRFLPMLTTTSWLGKEDPSIEPDIVAGELPGVLNWALGGLDRLEAQRRFTWPRAAIAAVTRLQDLASPVHAFIRDCCAIDPEARATVDDVWTAWKTWAADNGHGNSTKQLLGRNLSAAYPQVRARRNHEIGRFYEGIRLTFEPDQDEAEEVAADAIPF